MTIFKQALANAKLTILLMLFINILLAGVCFFAVIGLISAPKAMAIYVPPTIPDTGLYTKSGIVPKSTIYSFTFYVWQSLQTWLTNGEKDYQKNLTTFAPYLTNDFRNQLVKEANALDSKGLLLNHEQTTFNAQQSGFELSDVRYVGHNTWLVHLVLRAVNQIAINKNNNGFASSHVVRDATTSYVFKVIRTDDVPRGNHWRLQLAGFAAPPKTMKIYQ